MLCVEGLRYQWPGAATLGPLSFTASSGEVIGVFGRSGTGKTTLFRILAGEIPPQAGSVAFDRADHRVYHDQQQKVVPWFSARQNMLLALSDQDRHRRRSEIENISKISGIEDFQDRDASKLSGGQRARVALARSLLEDAEMLLLDEPFTGVDALSQELIVSRLPQILGEKLTFITAHDPGILVLLATRIFCLKQVEGQIEGVIHEFLSPDFKNLLPDDRRRSSAFGAEVQGLLERLYE